MIKRLSGHINVTLAFIVLCVLLTSGACSTPGPEGFAIYLTKGDIPPAKIPALSHVDIEEQPIIAENDIISYNVITHEIVLTANAFDRISRLEVPVRGRSFVVCVDRQPIYWGAFWTPFSSLSFEGVTIMKPLGSRDSKIIQLEPGYPSSSFYRGEDPRNNAEVMRSLQQAGRLSIITSTVPVDKLPHSMKGYELYSWQENDQWHFTLITGTNRNKTLEEITSGENTVSADEWVHMHVVGIDAIKTVLGRLPQNEYVFWLSGLRSDQIAQDGANITLPASSITDTVKKYTEECGLDLVVQSP